MNPNTDKLVRRTTMVATVTAGYFLLTADYGPEPNVLDPVRFTSSRVFLFYSNYYLYYVVVVCIYLYTETVSNSMVMLIL
ncbi:hypothetical protein Hdeb2414_s0232g00842541 [Helianthus debilis subsp. tardiflorus]